MNTFALVIYAPPGTAAAASALNFSRALLAQGHSIYRLFFFQDGVHNASVCAVAPQDETDLPEQWQQLICEHDIDAVVCVSSALKRGLLDEAEAARYEKLAATIRPGFVISGLGQLIDAAKHADRLLNFLP